MYLNTFSLQGTGRSVVMMHGWGRKLDDLLPLGEILKTKSTPILVDLPGFGESTAPESVWSTFDYGKYIIDQIKEEKIDLLGHSFGGKIALSMAIKYPERVNKLILIATSGLKKRRTFFEKIKFSSIRTLGKMIKAFDKLFSTKYFETKFTPRFASLDYKNAGIMKPILVKSINEDFSSEIDKIKCKTLILWGEKDTETPPEIAFKLNKFIPGSKLIMFPYHGHDIIDPTSSHLLAKYILPFLEED